MEKNFEITWQSLWRVVGMLILIGIIYVAFDIWVAVILAIVISSALDPTVSWLEGKKIPRVVGSILIFLVLVLILALILYAILPVALTEFASLLKSIGKVGIPALGLQDATKLINVINQGLKEVIDVLSSGSISFVNLVSRVVGGVSLLASVFILSLYLTIDRAGVEKFLIAVLPSGYESGVLDVYFKTRKKIGKWLYGQILLSVSIGFAAFIGLWIIGVKYSLVLGILTGLLEIVPFVGPIVSGTIALLLAFSQSSSAVVYVLLLYLLIHYVESWFLAPMFMKMTTSLHPAAIVISLLVGARLFGFVGLILAVPLTVMVQELIESWAVEKNKKKTAVQI